MKRDFELMRKILFAIEENYKPGDGMLFGLNIDGYDMKTIAEHCDILYQQGFVKNYKASWGGDTIVFFQVASLTSAGYDYLELIRRDDVWEKTKEEIKNKNQPKTFETFAKAAGLFVGNVIKGMYDL